MAHSITRPSNYRHPRKFSTQNFKLQEPKDFEEMISLINKTNVSRTEFENLRLKNTFTHSFSFFSKIEAEGSEQTIFDLIQEITYEYYPKRKTVFEIGDFGSKFFLILKGSAYVLIREKDLESKIKFQGKTEKNNSFVNVKDKETVNLSKETPLSQRQSIKYDKVIEKLPFLINREEELLIMKYPDLKVDKILSFGDSFGELAIRESNALRLATIVCKENCHFAVISKNTFQRALKSHFSRIMDANITFLKDHPLFSDWKNVQLEQFYRNITSINLVKRQIIYNENDEAHCFYLIKDGEIEAIIHIFLIISNSLNRCQNFYFNKTIKMKNSRL